MYVARKTLFSFVLAFLITFPGWLTAQQTPHEKNGENYSATYAEAIAFYTDLANGSPMVEIKEYKDQ